MAIEWASSADKHGIDRADALYAIENAVYMEQEFDEPRIPGHAKPWLFIGPPRTPGGPLLEVMVEIVPPMGMVIFSCDPGAQQAPRSHEGPLLTRPRSNAPEPDANPHRKR